MIHLSKGECPTILKERAAEWTAEYLEQRAAGNISTSVRFRYRHPAIRDAIKRETFEKCAYCESKIAHVAPGDTEHLIPVSVAPEKILAWENLTYACNECNRRKLDYYSIEEPIANPYEDEPREHMVFAGAVAMFLTALGRRTIRTIELNRWSLFERRKEHLERVLELCRVWVNELDEQERYAIKTSIVSYVNASSEYSAAVRDYVAHVPEIGEEAAASAA